MKIVENTIGGVMVQSSLTKLSLNLVNY